MTTTTRAGRANIRRKSRRDRFQVGAVALAPTEHERQNMHACEKRQAALR